MPYLRPDAKSQVTLEYNDKNEIVRVDAVVVSTQHDPGIKQKALREDVIENVIRKMIPKHLIDRKTKFHVNPTGQFIIGGPHGDTGLTGRKIIVDTYGGKAPHGGGAFSGKDPTKVDRSAAYAARHLAKNIVAAGITRECTIQVSYAIGVAQPVSLMVDVHGSGSVPGHHVSDFIMRNIDMTPRGIIERLNLRHPIYRATAAYGHFGRPEFPWENLDLVEMLRKNFG
jgi:S-adenosylmethionine synthetase